MVATRRRILHDRRNRGFRWPPWLLILSDVRTWRVLPWNRAETDEYTGLRVLPLHSVTSESMTHITDRATQQRQVGPVPLLTRTRPTVHDTWNVSSRSPRRTSVASACPSPRRGRPARRPDGGRPRGPPVRGRPRCSPSRARTHPFTWTPRRPSPRATPRSSSSSSGRSREGVRFGTNDPMIQPDGCLEGLQVLDLDAETAAAFRSENARRAVDLSVTRSLRV